VLAGEGWHPGVIGIVASRVADQHFRPVFVFSLAQGIAKGSARSIPSFNLYQALSSCSDLLTRFGGHKQAAGLSLPEAQLPHFRARMAQIMSSVLTEDDFLRAIEIDATLSMSDITFSLVDEIARLEPFGCGNAEPVFGCRGLEATKSRIVGNNHLKMYLRQNGRGVDSIGFDLGGHLEMVDSSARIDAAFLPVLNEWEGGRSVQLNLRAIRPSGQS
jgi:single-stranded-DNA-specific exonuclease